MLEQQGPRRLAPGTFHWAAEQGPGHVRAGLLHGVMSSSSTWSRVAPALAARGWDVTAVDLAGHGEGPRPVAPADPLGALVDAASSALPGQVDVLVGHSLGAVVALALAGAHPGAARSVVLEDPPARSALGTELLADGAEALAAAVAGDRGAYWQQLKDANPGWTDQEVEQSVAALEACDTAEVARALRAGFTWELPAMVSRAAVPVLVVAAHEVEGALPIVQGTALLGPERQALVEMLPADRFVELPGGHSLHRDMPEQVVDLLVRFVASLGPGPHPG